MPSVVHFEIAVDDPERAIKFYSTVFDWKIQKWDQFDYWLASTKHEGEVGIDGALMKRELRFRTQSIPWMFYQWMHS
jgi:uncharacterized protein